MQKFARESREWTRMIQKLRGFSNVQKKSITRSFSNDSFASFRVIRGHKTN